MTRPTWLTRLTRRELIIAGSAAVAVLLVGGGIVAAAWPDSPDTSQRTSGTPSIPTVPPEPSIPTITDDPSDSPSTTETPDDPASPEEEGNDDKRKPADAPLLANAPAAGPGPAAELVPGELSGRQRHRLGHEEPGGGAVQGQSGDQHRAPGRQVHREVRHPGVRYRGAADLAVRRRGRSTGRGQPARWLCAAPEQGEVLAVGRLHRHQRPEGRDGRHHGRLRHPGPDRARHRRRGDPPALQQHRQRGAGQHHPQDGPTPGQVRRGRLHRLGSQQLVHHERLPAGPQ